MTCQCTGPTKTGSALLCWART